MNKIKGTIEQWFIITLNSDDPPEEARLSGRIDEKSKIFSGPVSYDPSTNILTTRSGSLYYLGEPSRKYEELYPNARIRFINHLLTRDK